MRMEAERMRMMNLRGRGSLRGEEKGKLSGIAGRGPLCGGGGGGGVVLISVRVESVQPVSHVLHHKMLQILSLLPALPADRRPRHY